MSHNLLRCNVPYPLVLSLTIKTDHLKSRAQRMSQLSGVSEFDVVDVKYTVGHKRTRQDMMNSVAPSRVEFKGEL